MNKATIIEDAITYIKQLQKRVNILKDQLVELEGSAEKTPWPTIPTDSTTPTQSNKSYIQADVSVSQIDEHKLWIKILFEKRKGAFTKLIQAMNSVGFELTDTSVTTVQGAVLVTTLINGIFCTSTAQQTEDLLLGIVNACI
ncbi:Transcription factor DYT1, partial [Cucurbita argyrosperma subsp. sororia]